jgi:riboflavin kinase
MIDMIRQPDNTGNRKAIKLRGIVTSGIGESKNFTEIPWVKEQFVDKLGINPYPGTFNIAVLAEDEAKLDTLRKSKGLEIIPQDEKFCIASSFPVLVNSRIRGATIIPLVANYPPAKLEIISAENIKQALSLNDGDLVEVEVYL